MTLIGRKQTTKVQKLRQKKQGAVFICLVWVIFIILLYLLNCINARLEFILSKVAIASWTLKCHQIELDASRRP